ncbi:hypothetical protein [Paenibacillus oryzisoli]|uniref:Uncharacterized protein n=1 Tax=Paenibacillus oryzisoli TaxID=1850517 RepID=A0A198ARB1_9BACL|nr:hypothetical protein [Paenibacillus oryzisoli]OAS23630.1 hypothetical protein A8708_31820 [Paenibacillus oryzisoli]
MIRKISKVISVFVLIGCLGFTVPALGAEQAVTKPGSITYEMQDIQVLYAAEFTAYPQATIEKATVSKSVYEAVYNDSAKPLQVLYGVVKLTMPTGYSFTEEFISVTDGVNIARGLSNGGGPIYNVNNQARGQSTEFVTGKKLTDKSVVKDYSDGWKTIRLTRKWDDYANPMDFTISFKWDLVGSVDHFFKRLTETSYVIDLSTLRHKGANQAVQR